MNHLNLIPDVDDERMRSGLHGDPAPVLPDLKARHVAVREEEGHAAWVGVRRETEGQVGLRALGVEIDPQASSGVVLSSERSLQVAFFQSEVQREDLHHLPSERDRLLPVLVNHFPGIGFEIQ